ncbi:cytidine deaminase [Thalassotalea marina]|uniref:Cytidine deaminase n=1 Tax=Thalassotalea marina TaxID=1673741 RepID=A0A919EP38_9GAMM|nr:cytidine deaminase [Thalassotalea marina]GHG08450.1 cytidine deaminase [Thalassotalea marina]
MDQVDNKLKLAAKQAYDNAYAVYSQFHVGAALLTEDGQVFKGCNVENASYGLTVCAERNCIAGAVVEGNTSFTHLVVYTEQEKLTPPCGACRQVIVEFMKPSATVTSINHLGQTKQWQVANLLPDAFLPEDLQ